LTDKAKLPGLPNKGLKLDSLANLRAEMARLYRLAATGKIELGTMTSLIYGLKEIRCCIEGEALDVLHKRLADIAARVKGW
jgi:hypothetical protein